MKTPGIWIVFALAIVAVAMQWLPEEILALLMRISLLATAGIGLATALSEAKTNE